MMLDASHEQRVSVIDPTRQQSILKSPLPWLPIADDQFYTSNVQKKEFLGRQPLAYYEKGSPMLDQCERFGDFFVGFIFECAVPSYRYIISWPVVESEESRAQERDQYWRHNYSRSVNGVIVGFHQSPPSGVSWQGNRIQEWYISYR